MNCTALFRAALLYCCAKPTFLEPSHCSTAGSSHHSRSYGHPFGCSDPLSNRPFRSAPLKVPLGFLLAAFGRLLGQPLQEDRATPDSGSGICGWRLTPNNELPADEIENSCDIRGSTTPAPLQEVDLRQHKTGVSAKRPLNRLAALERRHLTHQSRGGHCPPPPSSEHPRFLLRLRRRANARFTNIRRELFPEDCEPKPKLAYPGNLEGHLPSHRSAKERNHAIRRFLDSLQTPSPLESPTFTCPNQAFYLQV